MRSYSRFGILAIVFLLLFASVPASAQEEMRLTINSVDSSYFPTIDAYFNVTDINGLFYEGIEPSQLIVSEDQKPVAEFTVEELQNSSQPISLVLVIDTSESIRTGGTNTLNDVKSSALSFIDQLGTKDWLGVVSFSDNAQIQQELAIDKENSKLFINSVTGSGHTALYDGIGLAVEMLKKLPTGRKAIVVLTDGQDDSSSVTLDSVLEQVAGSPIPIYPIGFGAVDSAVMNTIAGRTGGHAQTFQDSAQLNSAFSAVISILRKQYKLTFDSSLEADGNNHELLIAFNHPAGAQYANTYQFIATPGDVRVELLGITENQNISGKVPLRVEVVAPADLHRVEYYLDGELLGTVYEKPLEYIWDTGAATNGTHTLDIKAYDQSGSEGSLSVLVNVISNITVEWIFPGEGETLSGRNAKLEVSAAADAGIARVEFYVDDNLLATRNEEPYEATWSLDDVLTGDHTLTVVVIDNNNQSLEVPRTVEVPFRDPWFILVVALLIGAIALVIGVPVALIARSKLKSKLVLFEQQGKAPGYIWSLEKKETRIGRKRDANDIPADGLGASRRHALIKNTGSEYILYNLMEDNPTIINGQKVFDKHKLAVGDTIQIGDSIFRVDKAS